VDVLEGRFREDLYYRLDVVHLRTAALRERSGDICELADAFLSQLAGEGLPKCSLSPAGSAVLVEFAWPGNVRQLRNVLEQAAIDSESPVITAELLQRIMSMSLGSSDGSAPPAMPPEAPTAESHKLGSKTSPVDGALRANGDGWLSLDEVERDHIARTLAHTFNNRSAAARLLGITRQALLRKLKRHRLD
jgi:two-component system NtrC family response regulator